MTRIIHISLERVSGLGNSLEELIAESRKAKYHWNFLRLFISFFQIGYFIVLWLAAYNLILHYAGPIPYDYWLIFFGMTAIIAVGAAQALLMFLLIPMRYLVKKEGYSFMPRKYAGILASIIISKERATGILTGKISQGSGSC